MSRLDKLRELRTNVLASSPRCACWMVLSHQYKTCHSESCSECIYEDRDRPRPSAGPTLEETIRLVDELDE